MTARKKRTGIEWVGGLVSMPAYVTGEGEPYRPETLFWMGAEGAVLGHTVGKPGELVDLACESLRSTIAARGERAAKLGVAKRDGLSKAARGDRFEGEHRVSGCSMYTLGLPYPAHAFAA